MLLKKIIAIICIMVLAIQVLPVKHIGCLLAGNSLNEEVAHNVTVEKPGISDTDIDHFTPILSAINNLDGTNNHSTHSHSSLINMHVAEVQTPPPNC